MEFLSFFSTKLMENCEAVTLSTHLFAYSYRLFKKHFMKNCDNLNFHNFLIFLSDLNKILTFLSENVVLFLFKLIKT